MKGLEKLTSVRLAEVLSQKNLVATEAITDALYSQDHFGECFVDILVSAGHINEWDLAKTVVDHFQIPFVMASNYDVSDEAKQAIPEEVLFKHQIVPLDVFGPGLTIAMPILTPFEVLDKIQREHHVDLFPSVGLISENKKVLQDHYPNFGEWQQKQEEAAQNRRSQQDPEERDWMNIFDTGDQAVKSSRSD